MCKQLEQSNALVHKVRSELLNSVQSVSLLLLLQVWPVIESTWPSDDQQINYGHESKGSQMHHCWRRKLWVKTHDDEQIYCAKTTMYFQINTPLYCRTVLSINMLKKPENWFFFTENWQKRVLNLRNYQIKGPGLATGWCRLLFSSECKGIAMHNFFWDTL